MDAGPSQPPSQPNPSSRFNFICFMSPCARLMAAMRALKQVEEAQEEDDLFTAMVINAAGIHFLVVNAGLVLALFTSPISDIFSLTCNTTIACKIDCSVFSDLLEHHACPSDDISIFKTQGKNRLLCHYGQEKKPKSFKVPLFELDEAIKFNLRGLEPLCTVSITSPKWRKGILHLLEAREEIETETSGMTFDVSWERVKFFTGEDMEEDKGITYDLQENCDITMIDEADEHEYTVDLPLVAEKPLTTASFLNGFGVMRLYFTRTAMVTLSFEQDPRKGHEVNHGSMVFVYYPSLFTDRAP